MSQAFRTRPSLLLGVYDTALAFFVDRAVHYFGSSVESDIEETVAGRKSQTAKNLARVTRTNTWLGVAQYRSV